jgi:signal transduction histidine kinase
MSNAAKNLARRDTPTMPTPRATPPISRWELAAETIAVKIRWFGLIIAYVLVNASEPAIPNQGLLNALLALGVMYALADTVYSFQGRVFLHRYPLLISFMEALFIGLLCYFHQGLDSPFRYYYLLSLICCAIRYPQRTTYTTCAMHCTSFAVLFLTLPEREDRLLAFLLIVVLMVWVTWASDAMAFLLKRVGQHLGHLNEALRQNQTELEARISERTTELQEAQALLLHQEKMAAFGLLAAGIAHEVGNPLTAISSMVQILQRREQDPYTQEKLGLVNGQLRRIQNTLRELTSFSRPAGTERALVSVAEAVTEALSIVKYYKRTRERRLETDLPSDLPPVYGKRDWLAQAVLNLVLNAIDATGKGGQIQIRAAAHGTRVRITVADDGSGIAAEHLPRLFRPYFTTKPHGTGLGLFVTQKLVSEFGGTVNCDSMPEQGTVFTITLPTAVRGQESGDRSQESGDSAAPVPESCLLTPRAGGV